MTAKKKDPEGGADRPLGFFRNQAVLNGKECLPAAPVMTPISNVVTRSRYHGDTVLSVQPGADKDANSESTKGARAETWGAAPASYAKLR